MKRDTRILVVDDKHSSRAMIMGYLDDAGYEVTCVASGSEALAELEKGGFNLVLSDLTMPVMDGVALLRQVRGRYPRLPFVLIATLSTIDRAVAALEEGAEHYLLKPLNRVELLIVVERLLESARLKIRYDQVLEDKRQRFAFQNIPCSSPAMCRTLALAQMISASPRTTVTIYGESGTGKEFVARAIHSASGHNMTRFVTLNCSAVPETLLEAELFGQCHNAGQQTGAESEGACRRAGGGTLFLDEISAMPLSVQPKLLRLLEERVYTKIGSEHTEAADFGIIITSSSNLSDCCDCGTLLRELYYRLNSFAITIPPLRERREDIPLLAGYFLSVFRQHQGKPLPGLSQEALTVLVAHDWPGNVRELRNQLEYATINSGGELIRPEHLRLQPAAPARHGLSPSDQITLNFTFSPEEFSLDAVTSQVMAWALEKSRNNKSSAARLLKASRKLFY